MRLLCDQQDYETAKRTAIEAEDTAATFFLARRLEALGRSAEAAEMYVRAKRPAFAAAQARRLGVPRDVQRFAALCDDATKLRFAEWLLGQGERDRAATLFQSAGAQARPSLFMSGTVRGLP